MSADVCKKKKKQRTRWIFRYVAGKGTGIRVGWIHNKNGGVPDDKIRLQIQSMHGFWDHHMRIDEGLAVCTGIAKVLAVESINKNIGLL